MVRTHADLRCPAARGTWSIVHNRGIFAGLGEGFVPYPEIFQVLDAAGFNGWLIVETDKTARESPLVSATISREYLRSLGIQGRRRPDHGPWTMDDRPCAPLELARRRREQVPLAPGARR